jgi:transposase
MYGMSHAGSCNWSVRAGQLTRKVFKKRAKTVILRFWEMADWKAPPPPGKLKNEDKARILSWKEDGMSTAEIAKRLGRHRASIDRLWAKSKGLPKFVIPQRKIGSGRPKKMTNVMRKMLKRQAVKFPEMTAADLQNSVPELRTVSERTIQRTLQRDLKMPSRIAAQKPLLTMKMKAKRLKFAKAYRHWTSADWAKVMYSDESTFKCLRSVRGKVRRPRESSRFDSRYTVKTVKHPDSVMVWGCFSGTLGRGGLYFLPKNVTMNGERYQTVLEDHLLRFMELHGCTHFLQDGAPCHASKRIKAFLAEQPFQVIDWPGNSPDLNPIENCWNHMKNLLKKKDISSVPKLITAIKELWTMELSTDYLKKLSKSMPGGLKMVIDAHGDMTKY